jgi:flagellar motor switch/type III secretory pathway protein FliN
MIQINLEKALEIHKTKIREKRESVFKDLDIQFMKALEQGNTTLSAEIGAKKQALRDVTNINSGSITTLDEVKALWDVEILGETPYK